MHRLFGIDKEGIMDVDPVTGKVNCALLSLSSPYDPNSHFAHAQVNFTHRYVDISEWKTDKSGKLFELVNLLCSMDHYSY